MAIRLFFLALIYLYSILHKQQTIHIQLYFIKSSKDLYPDINEDRILYRSNNINFDLNTYNFYEYMYNIKNYHLFYQITYPENIQRFDIFVDLDTLNDDVEENPSVFNSGYYSDDDYFNFVATYFNRPTDWQTHFTANLWNILYIVNREVNNIELPALHFDYLSYIHLLYLEPPE